MKDLESLSVQYLGYKSPESEKEVNVELLGLDTVIAAAEQRKAILLQGLAIQGLVLAEEESVNEETEQEG